MTSFYSDENREWEYESLFVPEYEKSVKESWIYKELYDVRNVRPSFHNRLGLYGGLLYTGAFVCVLNSKWLTSGFTSGCNMTHLETLGIDLEKWTLSHGGADYKRMKPASESKKIVSAFKIELLNL